MIYTLLTPWDEMLDWEKDTPEDCLQAAQEWFSRQYDDEPMKNGEARSEVAYIVQMGDGEEVSRDRVELFYEKERSEFDEHCSYGR